MRVKVASTTVVSAVAALAVMGLAAPAYASNNTVSYTLPGSQGTVTANAWRTTGDGNLSGNTRQWDYQVSAYYAGSKAVQRIRDTWYSGAALQNGASMNLGISDSGITVGSSSSWQYVTTPEKYWENANGATSSSWRSNIVVAPQQYYLASTIYIASRALVKVSSDTRTFEITASV